ncbi:MAG: tRNA (adenosine(37)-N6)-threonylcarbamoyltransferase complex transferase subunit TsaD [Deltaproteobacteria bacterium]|nr:tRNA (adenosine(37)-N6)-threonylcarbamoyltransferase complex transferase subunit TsaD [Deltaproteobacteria bacterium]
MMVLGIETSCDETAVAVLRDRTILADCIASQDDIHTRFGGIVPELASRRHIEVLPQLAESARTTAGIEWRNLDAIAVTRAPGLIGCLLVGLSFAKALAFALDKPLIGVNHLEGHLLAAQLFAPELVFPFVGLVVSGGHTSLYHARALGQYELLGATRDDAAGEAYDKVAKLLGLGFPGGPQIDRLAATGNAKAARFARPNLKVRGSPFEIAVHDFSFSGLKTAVAQLLQRSSPPAVADIAAGFQHRVVEELVRRLVAAAETTGCRQIVVSGGVAANRALRARLETVVHEHQLQVFIPPVRFCTDNAVMIAWAGMQHLQRGERSGLDLNAAATEELGHVGAA